MLCEEVMSHVENTSNKVNNTSPSSLVSFISGSWSEEVLRAEYRKNDELNSSADSVEHMKLNAAAGGSSKQNREIAVEFIENANEAKFERLIKQEKLNPTFKRRLSHTNSTSTEDSRSNSPNSDDASNPNNRRRTTEKGRQQFSHKEEKRIRRTSHTSSASSSSSTNTEVDAAILSRRQKQIDYGKNTAAYERYVETVPRSKRNRDHPRTPNKHEKYSRRAFDGLVRIWRKQLHYYDPPGNAEKQAGANETSSDSDSD